jgi:cytochrome P450
MQFDFDIRPGEDLPLAAHRRLREAGPVVWADNLSGWLVSSYDDVRQVLGDVAHFTSEGTPVTESFGGEAMLVNDTPMHHTMRAVWAKSVSGASMAAREAELEANARRVLEAVQPRLAAGEAVDFIPVFRDFVMEFIASSFAVSRARLDVFQRWSQLSADTPALALEEGSPAHQRHMAVREEVYALLRNEVADRRARFAKGEQPGDLVSLMVAAEGHNDITAAMVFDNLFNFILGAMDTTEKWLGNVVVRLCASPDLRAEVAADPSLIPAMADEVMRCDTVAQVIQRKVRSGGAELDGERLGGGDAVYLMLGAASRDPVEFDHADRLDIHRLAKPQLGFGFGFHHCLGINIARAEVAAFVKVLLAEMPPLQVARADYGSSWALLGPRVLEVGVA